MGFHDWAKTDREYAWAVDAARRLYPTAQVSLSGCVVSYEPPLMEIYLSIEDAALGARGVWLEYRHGDVPGDPHFHWISTNAQPNPQAWLSRQLHEWTRHGSGLCPLEVCLAKVHHCTEGCLQTVSV